VQIHTKSWSFEVSSGFVLAVGIVIERLFS